MTDDVGSHRTDCWGRLNDAPDLAPVLTILEGLPRGFADARRAMIARLGLRAESSVLDAGCGPGTALADLLPHVGPGGRIVGFDPTREFVTIAEERAQAAGAGQAAYRVGDIRSIDVADATFDAAFCDKILVHVSPVSTALSELVRVTRPGGRVGAVEWYSQGMVIAGDYTTTRRVLDGSAPLGALNPEAPLELERLFGEVGLTRIESGSVVAETAKFVPAIRMMVQRRVQQAVDLGALSVDEGQAWLADLERRDEEGGFYWGAIVRWAVGARPQE